jgi:hypothetical protein
MKAHTIVIILMLLLMIPGAALAAPVAASPDDPGWPRVIKKDGKELVIYQPQIDSWQDYKNIHARFAIAIIETKTKKETFGVVEVDAETVVDQAARVVAVLPKKRELRFPNTTDAEAAALRKTVEELHPPQQALTVSLDRVLAYLDPAQQRQQPAVELNMNPPKIFFSRKPAILVMVLGEPKLQPVDPKKNDLLFVANTNWDMFYDTARQEYFLLNQESWLTTKDVINGPWTPAATLPAGLSSLPATENWDEVRKQVPGKPDSNPPMVLITREPAELILTEGEPTYMPIPGTALLRMNNTESVAFLNSGDKRYYFLTAGRWFRAASLDGPWSYAGNDLPADFARIPDDDPAAFVKASVPGTTEAKDAVLLASIPATTALDVNTPPKVEVAYSGQPNFQPIPSTTVQYATNTASAVFLVNNAYYCCEQGVWYSSNTPSGPWTYCTNVPAAIYTIPATHPTHNVTYVTVQSSTPSTVVYSQTAGYSGEYVAANGVLMFGAGMILGAIINDNYNDHYHYPVPYSYGWGARYNYGYGGYYRPAYGHYGPYRGAGVATAYNPRTGTYARGAYVSGYNGSVAAGRAYNPYTGARAAGARVDTAYGSAGRGAAYNPRTGTAVRGGYRSSDYGTVAGAQTNRGTGAVAWDTARGQGAVVKGKGGNVYAGKDGNVYKKDNNGNWSSNSGNGWQSVDRDASRGNVQSQAQTRQRSDTAQTSRAQVQQPSTARQPDRSRTQQPSRSQLSPSTRDLDSQAQARSRGNQLSRNSSRFASQSGSRGSQVSGAGRAQAQPRASGGGRSGGGGGGRRR